MINQDVPQDTTRYRTIVYVDGFNLYYGLKDAGLTRLKWLNVHTMAASLVRLPFVLSQTKYFTARVAGAHPGDSQEKAARREAGRRRQAVYLEALETVRCLAIYEGTYYLKRDHCRSCNADFVRPEEKMTDTNIATELVTDAFLNRYDCAVVVSGDSDLVPPIRTVKQHFPAKRLTVAFPPCRQSSHLRQIADAALQVWPRTLERSLLPLEIVKRDGTILRCPTEWQ